MLRFWKLIGQPTLFFFDPDDGGGMGADDDPHDGDDPGGGAEDHPDFAIPAGVGGAEDGDEPAVAASAKPAGKAGEKPAGKSGGEPVESVPKHRFDEVIGQRDDFQRKYDAHEVELQKLRRLIGASLGITDPADEGKPKPLTPREQAIQQRMYALVPGLENILKLSDKVDALAGIAQSMPDFDRQNKQYWTRVARSMFDGMEAKIAPLLLGERKTVTDMDPKMRARYRADFVQWVQSDEQRVDRYEALDQSLIDDYRKEIDDTVVAPLRRQYGASALTRSRAVDKLPVAGGSGTPTRTPKPKAEPMDEDAAADAAWKNLQERISAAS
jgi:hypothetical protein